MDATENGTTQTRTQGMEPLEEPHKNPALLQTALKKLNEGQAFYPYTQPADKQMLEMLSVLRLCRVSTFAIKCHR